MIANYVTPENDCKCDQSMRGFEMSAIAALGRQVVMIERREGPVVELRELMTIVPLSS
jgi:hypothetical protein